MIPENINKEILKKPSIFPFLIIIIFGLIIRFLWLDADPPVYFYGQGQDLLTDPYNVIHFARNKALFDRWDIFDYNRWIVFKYSLSSLAAYLAFLVGGVSRVSANLSAVILNILGILLFSFGLKKSSVKAF